MGIYRLKNPDFFKSFDVDFANSVFYSNLRQFELTTHDTLLSLKVAIRGPEEYVVDRKLLSIPEGYFSIINPRETIETFLDSRDYVEGISIFLDKDLVRDICWNVQQRGTNIEPLIPENSAIPWFEERITPIGVGPVGTLLKSVARAPMRIAANDEFFCALTESLVTGQKNYWNQLTCLSAIKTSTRVEIHRRLQIARQAMLELSDPALTIGQLSQFCMLSKYNLIRFFKAVYGVTPYQFLSIQKIEKAKAILVQDREVSIAEVATILGFADHSSFGKRFKAITGCSPNEYRNASQK